MSYREAKSTAVLLATVNKLAPGRSKASDGWIGDAAHASRTSDHNPWIKDARGVGVVRARDFTVSAQVNGPALAESLAQLLGKHPAMGAGAYVIHNRRIISTNRLREGWRAYTGANPHTKHVHVSVGLRGYDSRTPWPVRVQPAAKPTNLSNARVLLRKALANATSPVRRKRISDALDDLPAR